MDVGGVWLEKGQERSAGTEAGSLSPGLTELSLEALLPR